MSLSRKRSYRGQPVVVTVRATGEELVGRLRGWGPRLIQLDLEEGGYRELATSERVEAVLDADECAAAGVDPMVFTLRHGRPVTAADLTPAQLDAVHARRYAR